jgi:hypothetical protein
VSRLYFIDLDKFPSKGGNRGRLSGSSTYEIEYTQLATSDNRLRKSADGREATEAAWLNGNNSEKEEIKKKKQKNERKG